MATIEMAQESTNNSSGTSQPGLPPSTAKLGLGARIMQGIVLAGLVVMTAAAAYQTWKQVTLPDFRLGSGGSTSGKDAPVVEWNLLRELDLKSGKAAPNLQQYDGKQVRIPGFVVPLEDNKNMVSEFLLVPYVGACIHTPPPPPNQIVQVRTADQKPVSVNVTDPVWIVGELRIASSRSQYGDVSYQMRAIGVEPYREKEQ